jgi:hypothetical protein
MLMIATELDVTVSTYQPVGGHQITGEQLKQRGLAGAVGADKRNACVQIDAEVEILVDEWL